MSAIYLELLILMQQIKYLSLQVIDGDVIICIQTSNYLNILKF